MELTGGLQRFLTEYSREIEQEAALLKEETMPEITEELFALFEQTGNRIKYEDVYFKRRKFLAVLGLKALMELEDAKGNEKANDICISEETRKHLTEVMLSICQEECWALPAHVNRTQDKDWRINVDLFASETAQTLSELADRLRECLPEEVYEIVVENVERRVFVPFFSSQVPYRGWEHAEHNWNAVCAGAIGSACMHLMKNQPERLEKCLERICQALPYYISGFAEDGACMEGLGYFTYGMTFFVNFAQELYTYTGGAQDLFCGKWGGFEAGNEDKRSRIAAFQGKCYFSDGNTISFSDGSSTEHFRVGLSCILSEHYPQIELPSLDKAAGLKEDSCYRFAALKMDLLDTKRFLLAQEKKGKGREEEPTGQSGEGRVEVFPDAQWCIANSQNGIGMACKGGHNDEPHNHNDIGHFLYEADGETILEDLGAGEYTRDYFGAGRYEIFCNSSFSHSVPIIGGEGQCPGRAYSCGSFQAGKQGNCAVMEMDFPAAYREGLLKNLNRRICFDLTTGELRVQDRFVLNEKTVLENLVTRIPPRISGNQICLQGKSGKATIYLDEEIPESAIKVEEHVHSNHQGIEEKIYTIQWQVFIKEGKGESSFRVKYQR